MALLPADIRINWLKASCRRSAGVGRFAYFCKKATTTAISCWIPPKSLNVSSIIFSSLGRNSSIMASRGKWNTRQRLDKAFFVANDLSIVESMYSLYFDLNSRRSVTDSSNLTLTWNTLWSWEDSSGFFERAFDPRRQRNIMTRFPLFCRMRDSLFVSPSKAPDCFPSTKISGVVLQISSRDAILSASWFARVLSSSEYRWELMSINAQG